MNDSLDWLNEFLQICCSDDLEEMSEQLQNAVQILKKKYENKYRHRYSAIAALLKRSPYSDYSSDQFDMLRSNMEYIENNFDILGFTEEARESSIKLFDHLILEVDRINNIDRRIEQIQAQEKKNVEALAALNDYKFDVTHLLEITHKLINDNSSIREKTDELEAKQHTLSEQYDKYDDKLKSAREELNRIGSRIEGFNTQSITILSIFTAIVFAFTGGFTMLGNAFSNISGISRNESIMLISIVIIVGCILLDVIYFLLVFIGKMSNIPFSGNCNLDCTNCKKKNKKGNCTWWTRFKNRHFMIKCANIAVFLVVSSLLIINMLCITPDFPKQAEESNLSETTPLLPSNDSYTPLPTGTVEPTITPTPTQVSTVPPEET